MEAIGSEGTTENLRRSLRGATAQAHDLLDHSMRAASGWSALEDYAQFLTLQHAARAPVEEWMAKHAEQNLLPPPQCPAIERDLAALSLSPLRGASAFTPHGVSDTDDHTLGVAWVLAGSSLGNRSILKEVIRAGHGDWPTAFLSDDSMLTYWQSLRRRIERPAGADEVAAASAAAAAVFDHFVRVAETATTEAPLAEPAQ